MHSLTKAIEERINEMLNEAEDCVSLSRKDLAASFGCVPSQINYVLRSRFTPERGFIVESQRGGHGYIRVLRISYETPDENIAHMEDLIGDFISDSDCRRLLQSLQERGIITARERLLMEVSLRHSDEMSRNDFDLSPHKRSIIRAEILKRLIRAIVLA